MTSTRTVALAVIATALLSFWALTTYGADAPTPAPEAAKQAQVKPSVIILLMQCDRPLGLLVVADNGAVYEVSAEKLTPEQITKMGHSVDEFHRHMTEVPCVSHTKHELPGELHGVDPGSPVSI